MGCGGSAQLLYIDIRELGRKAVLMFCWGQVIKEGITELELSSEA